MSSQLSMKAVRTDLRFVAAIAFVLAIVVAAPGRAAAPVPSRERPIRVLFIGNSQTSTNDLPAFVAEIAKVSKHAKVTYRTIAPSATTLAGLWYGRANPALVAGKWDAVVLQQGPSVVPERQAELCFYAKEFADSARENGAKPYLMMVWPRRGGEFSQVYDAYSAAAVASGATLLPAGAAWSAALRRIPTLPLYAWDGIHPGRLGTYLAALVVYAGLKKIPPVAPNSLVVDQNPFWIPPAQARLFRDAATEALRSRPSAASCSDV
jgi:hypothetical protein